MTDFNSGFHAKDRHWLLNGPRGWRWLPWLADELLDRIPAYEDGRWYRRGGWGCRLRLHRWWDDPAGPRA